MSTGLFRVVKNLSARDITHTRTHSSTRVVTSSLLDYECTVFPDKPGKIAKLFLLLSHPNPRHLEWWNAITIHFVTTTRCDRQMDQCT